MFELPITPVPKPRQTKSDKWKKRPCVLRYRAFADRLRFMVRVADAGLPGAILSGAAILFVIPCPKSWSNKKKVRMIGTPHTQTPDIDNLQKAFLDALFKQDSKVHTLLVMKVWGESGCIKVVEFDPNFSRDSALFERYKS